MSYAGLLSNLVPPHPASLAFPRCEAVLQQAAALPLTRGGWSVETGMRHLLATDSARWAPIFNAHGIPEMLRGDASDGCTMSDQEAAVEAPFHSLLQTIVYAMPSRRCRLQGLV